jgi:hypothetical protein
MGVPASGRRSISLAALLHDSACGPLAGSQDPGRATFRRARRHTTPRAISAKTGGVRPPLIQDSP